MRFDVDTLLTRQMELHTTVRHPPKNAEHLSRLHETMRNYHYFFSKLKSIAEDLRSDRETVFQCFMYISMGGAVSFDKQHQDGSVPMHQAKVLARTTAIELEPAVRKAIPVKELMVYVGLSKDLRTTLRVKVEDGNDLLTAEKSVDEALEYLDYIGGQSAGDASRMFAFYMVEDPETLGRMLGDSSEHPSAASGSSQPSSEATRCTSLTMGTMRDINGWALTLTTDLAGTIGSSVGGRTSLTPLPTPLESLPEHLQEESRTARDAKATANVRVKSSQAIVDWLGLMPTEFFVEHISEVVSSTGAALTELAGEKRSALCRLGCSAITVLIQRLSHEPYLHSSEGNSALGPLLTAWTQTLCKGVFVTVAAISTATDAALRALVLESHGHTSVVKAVLAALQSGTQTELRRKCLGYLALSLSAAMAHAHNLHAAVVVPAFTPLLVASAQQYVQTGDSPSRKMARALCAVLRSIGGSTVPIADPKTEKLILLEQRNILPFADDPRELERVLFETNDLVSSIRPGMDSVSSQSHPSSAGSRGSAPTPLFGRRAAPREVLPRGCHGSGATPHELPRRTPLETRPPRSRKNASSALDNWTIATTSPPPRSCVRPAGSSRTGDVVFETNTSLGAAHGDEEDDGDVFSPDYSAPGHAKPRAQHDVGCSPKVGAAANAPRTVPLSLRPTAVRRSTSPCAVARRSPRHAAHNPTSRSRSRRSSEMSIEAAGSSTAGSSPEGHVPRLSDSLKRKIDAAHR